MENVFFQEIGILFKERPNIFLMSENVKNLQNKENVAKVMNVAPLNLFIFI